MRRSLVPVLTVAALLAGCGGSDTGSTTDSAAMAPSGAGLYVSVDTNRDGDQWQKLDALVEKVPGGRKAFEQLLSDFTDDSGLDLEQDILPAVGDELVVVLPARSANPVVLVQPEDEEKLRQLAESKDHASLREVDGWTAIAESEAAIDAYEKSLDGGRLADDRAFAEAMDDLPADTLVRAYVVGEGLQGVLSRAQAGALGALGGLGGLGGGGSPSADALGTIALGVAAEDEGLRFEGSVEQEGLPGSEASKLLPRVPSGAFVAGTFRGGEGLKQQFRKAMAGNEEQLRQFEQLTGLALDDVLELFEGEAVFYMRPGLPIPEITLAVESTGGQLATIDKVFQRFAEMANTPIRTAVEDGVRVKLLGVQGVSVRYAETGGLVVVTTGPGGIRALAGTGSKLVDDAAFKTAAAEVGYDGSTSGFLYVDVNGIAPILQGFLGLAGGSTPGATAGLGQLADALEAFDSVALNVTSAGGTAKFEGFVRVN